MQSTIVIKIKVQATVGTGPSEDQTAREKYNET
jgi:hypothetical protein